jgi:acyl dehydratase
MTLTLEDFPPGRFGTFGPRHVTREEMLAFAAEFDPQPMHLDEEAAKRSMLKGLSGSGWHLCSIIMRMMFDGFIGRKCRRRGAVRDSHADHRAAARGWRLMRFFEDMEIGQRREVGSFTFTAEAIKKFAAQFDPQRFHLDEEAGRKSLFGGLAASGWHVGSVCMKLLIADALQQSKDAAARGEAVAVWGPSPGFRELRWIRPVLAGDTIGFSSEIETKRTSSSRPEWGILQARNTGTNQRGELVYSVLATAFVPRRGG